MSGPATATARHARHARRARVLAVLLGACAAVLGACAATPGVERDRLQAATARTPASAPPGAHAVARQVDVSGPQGPMGVGERSRVLQDVGREGRSPELFAHLQALSSFDQVDLYSDNGAVLLIDGPATFAAMFKAIEAARHSILLDSYIIEDAAVARRLAELLARKRAAGVEVAMVYDSVGSIGTDNHYFDDLKTRGIAVCAFNPVNPLKRVGYWDIAHRDHRKILVVDRRSGFTGGINISAVYTSGSFSHRDRVARPSGDGRPSADKAVTHDGWRDTQVQITGPAAAALDDLVRQTWGEQGCLPALRPAAQPMAASLRSGDTLVRIVASAPDGGMNRIYAMLLGAIDHAQHSVHLSMAYFAPGDEMVQALADAARRGVDVQLILPAVSDFKPVLMAGRSHYEQLLSAGVQIYELQDAVLHAKTAVIDGVVSTVGSSNMDWRSFVSNSEVNAVIFGEAFGERMQAVFARDLQDSQRITLQAWRDRPIVQRIQQWLARVLERLW